MGYFTDSSYLPLSLDCLRIKTIIFLEKVQCKKAKLQRRVNIVGGKEMSHVECH
jgi:hypothetical protein